MMYSNKFAVALKVGGKILRERGETVYVPFGSEYTLLLKNLNSLDAIAHIEIDGKQVVPGGLVVRAGQSIDIERFVESMEQGNRFKFIERTAKIESGPRGIKIDDGLIKVQFEFAREKAKIVPAPIYYPPIITTWPTPVREIYYYHDRNAYLQDFGVAKGEIVQGQNNVSFSAQASASPAYGSAAAAESSETMSREVKTSGFVPVKQSSAVHKSHNSSDSGVLRTKKTSIPRTDVNDVGITVAGSLSTQRFFHVDDFPLDGVKHVMILKILGEVEGQEVTSPVTVKFKPTCSTCGHQNKATAKFCTECGTALQLF